MATKFEYATEVAQMVGNAEVKEVEKANGVKFTGIVVHQGTICPTIYVDDMYKRGMSVEDAAREVQRIAEDKNAEGIFDSDKFLDYQGFVKDRLRIRLFNKATKAEVKRSAKSLGFDDLILVPYVNVELGDTKGSIKVLKQHVERWGVTQRQVIDTAIKNSKGEISVQSLEAFLGIMMFGSGPLLKTVSPESEIMDGPIVVTNAESQNGASAILGLIPGLKKKYPEGFYVIPSSVHEVIMMPKGMGQDVESLTQMVSEVNQAVLDPVDVLSDKAYEF